MSKIIPFCAVRPAPDKVSEVVSHSVEAYSKESINRKLKAGSNSFLQIIFAGKELKSGEKEMLKAIKQKFIDFRKRGIFEQEATPSIYVYRQIKDGQAHTGIIALASVEDYENGVIKIHEHTLEKRVEKLKDYLSVCDFNAEPVSIAYPHHNELDTFLSEKIKEHPLYDFTTDLVQHSVWKISSPETCDRIVGYFKKIPFLYIADGHHRVASSVLLARSKREQNKAHTGKEPYNFFMAAFFADKQLSILNFNRTCSTLNGLSSDAFLSRVSNYFDIYPKGHEQVQPASANEISMYLDKNWYMLKIKARKSASANPVELLDVSVLSEKIFASILNITDLRNDRRVTFVPGTRDVSLLIKAVDSGKMKVAFCLHPISFGELKAVADSGGIMPPKSTWIEPKLENGLLIYSLS